MSKELTPLQALKEFKNLKYLGVDVENTNEYKVIETALKDYENLQLKHRSMQDAVLDDFKKLKALEIIKKKKCIYILALKRSANWRAYNEFILPLNRYNGITLFDRLTQKEYEFLKEMLK